jgi:hypothetical protein
MPNITLEAILAKLPITKLTETITMHIQPLLQLLPDKRLWAVVVQMVLGILGSQTPVLTEIAGSNSKREGKTWAIAKRMYRLIHNQRVPTDSFYQGLYAAGQQVVERENPGYLVVAVDPVNFEKPYAEAIEGVSTVYKATPPGLDGKARLAHGYPSITATVVNTKVPVTSYANWFSYATADFVSQNREIERCFENTCRLYPQRRIRFVGDSGLDDQKMFAKVGQLEQEFVFRAYHLDRIVEVYNERLHRWETESLQDLTATLPYQATFQVTFTHAGSSHEDTIKLGWLKIRIPGTTQELWVLVADDQTLPRQLVLITNVPLLSVQVVQQVYEDWRLRGRIEHGYRFDQEQGLDVEDMRVHTLDRMRRVFAMVLLAAQIVFVIDDQWPPKAVRWLRVLGGKLERSVDRDGPYWLLQGIAAVIVTAMTISFIALQPFPFEEFSCG